MEDMGLRIRSSAKFRGGERWEVKHPSLSQTVPPPSGTQSASRLVLTHLGSLGVCHPSGGGASSSLGSSSLGPHSPRVSVLNYIGLRRGLGFSMSFRMRWRETLRAVERTAG